MVMGAPPALRSSMVDAGLRPVTGRRPSRRRRKAPSASSASMAARAAGPNSSRSLSVSGGSYAAQAGAGRARRDWSDRPARPHAAGRTGPRGGAAGRRPGGRRCRPARPGRLALAAGPTGLLPHRGDRAREAVEHHGVQPADVHPQLQGVGGGEAEQPARDQALLQLAPLLGQEAGPVGADPAGQAAVHPGDPVPGEGGDQLGGSARAGEAEGADPGLDGSGQPGGRLGVGRCGACRWSRPAGRLPEGEGDGAAGGSRRG